MNTSPILQKPSLVWPWGGPPRWTHLLPVGSQVHFCRRDLPLEPVASLCFVPVTSYQEILSLGTGMITSLSRRYIHIKEVSVSLPSILGFLTSLSRPSPQMHLVISSFSVLRGKDIFLSLTSLPTHVLHLFRYI